MTFAIDAGEKRRLVNATPPGADRPWYINDHTLIQDAEGAWHVFGIWHPEPAAPLDETFFIHATAPTLTSEWTYHEPVMHARTDVGETHVWAPHVIHHDGQYVMFYCGGTEDHSRYRIDIAVSDDLFAWTHSDTGPLFEDGFDARDPMVMRHEGRWLMYYTRTSHPEGGSHEVAVRESHDLTTWSQASVAYRSPKQGTFGGPTESPFVIRVSDRWLLFICDSDAYDRTLVFESETPTSFLEQNRIDVDLDEHCAEIVTEGERFWITGGGWGHGGLSIRPLTLSRRP